MEFNKPPVSAMGGGVNSVKTARFNPPRPRRIVSIKIHDNQNKPNAMAQTHAHSATALVTLRRLCIEMRDSSKSL
jgi:hypothetical protein